MFPNDPNNHSDAPASLPLVPPSGQPQQPASQPENVNPVQAGSNTAAAVHYATQAKRLVGQYGNDPYKLSSALGQLKSAYLSEQFHISFNQTGN